LEVERDILKNNGSRGNRRKTAPANQPMGLNNNIFRQPLFWLAMVLGGLILSPLLWYGAGMDQALYLYGAWVWKNFHLPPYIGAWDSNFPGIFIIHRLAMAMFGESILGFRILDLLVQLSCLAMIFALARRLTGSDAAAFITCLLYGFYYLGRGRWDAGQRDAFVFAALLAALFCSVVLDRRLWLRAVLTGLFAGLAFLIRPTYGLAWVVFGGFFLCRAVRAKRGAALSELLVFGFFCLAPCLLVVFYYWHGGWLREMYRAVILYNFEVYSRLKPPAAAQTAPGFLVHKLYSLFGSQPVIFFLALLSILFQGKSGAGLNRSREIFQLLLIFICLSAFSYLLLGKDLQYQLIPFWGFAVILSSAGLSAVGTFFKRIFPGIAGRVLAWTFYLMVCVFMFVSIPPNWTIFAFRQSFRELDAAYLSGTGASDELLSNSHYLPARYLQTVVGKDDGVEVFGAHPLIAFLLKKKLPSRFAMVQHLMFCPPGSGLSLMQRQGIEEYTRAVMSARPRFFVIAEQGIYFGTCLSRPSLKQGLAELFPELSTFLERNYMPLKKISQTEIFELKPGIEQGRPGNGAKP
jgi:hypothetical protein